MTIEKVKPMTPTIAIIPMNLTPWRSYLIFIGFGNNIDRTIEPLAVLNPVETLRPLKLVLWRETNRSLIRQSRIHRKWPNAKVLWLLYEIQVKWNFKKLIKIGSRFRVWISDYSYERPNPFLVMWTSMRFVLPQMIKVSEKHAYMSNLYEIPLCFTG